MEKRNTTPVAGETSAAVKAAAWAWYQHGSGGKSPTECEFEATRTFRKHGHGPSRFKRQAVNISVPSCELDLDKAKKKNLTESIFPPSSNPSNVVDGQSSDLLDAYEIKSISNQLDFLTRSSTSTGGKFFGTNNMDSRRRVVSLSPEKGLQRKKYETKLLGLKIRHGVICGGSRNDVVEPVAFNRGRSLSEKHGAFVSRRQQ